jgi:hypothetical protein
MRDEQKTVTAVVILSLKRCTNHFPNNKKAQDQGPGLFPSHDPAKAGWTEH